MEKAKEVNEKYKISEKISNAKDVVVHKAKDVDEKYEITNKIGKV